LAIKFKDSGQNVPETPSFVKKDQEKGTIEAQTGPNIKKDSERLNLNKSGVSENKSTDR
jgi:hypothetical protein